MKQKYSKEEIVDVLRAKNYEPIGEIKNISTKVLCKTIEGYLVLVSPSGILRRNDNAQVFSQYNPYTIYNINIWIKNNGYTCKLISKEYKNSKEKLEWECECGEHYFKSWNEVNADNKRYCNYCSRSKRYDGLVDYNDLVYQECVNRNYYLLPDQNILRSSSKFLYICNKHKQYGVQESTPHNFVTDYGNGGCTLCCIEKRSLSKRKDDNYFRNITESSGMIYIGVKYDENDKTRIIYKCPKHLDKGEFSTYITNMKNNKGNCPCCNGMYRTKEDLQNEIDELNLSAIILEYTDYSSPILCECKLCKKTWYTTGVNLTQGHSCPNCSKSRLELSVQFILDKFNLSYIPQYKFDDCRDKNPLPFDFYLDDMDTALEVDGEGHYMPIKYSSSWTDEDTIDNFNLIKKHDKIKTNYCLNNNIKLIRIPYYERNNIESLLQKELFS